MLFSCQETDLLILVDEGCKVEALDGSLEAEEGLISVLLSQCPQPLCPPLLLSWLLSFCPGKLLKQDLHFAHKVISIFSFYDRMMNRITEIRAMVQCALPRSSL